MDGSDFIKCALKAFNPVYCKYLFFFVRDCCQSRTEWKECKYTHSILILLPKMFHSSHNEKKKNLNVQHHIQLTNNNISFYGLCEPNDTSYYFS